MLGRVARPELTHDALFGGALSLKQPRVGYRANVDALLVAAFAAGGRRAREVVDLGAGVGTIGLALAHVGAARQVVLVERQAALAALARENLVENGISGSVEERDLERLGLPRALVQQADLVVCNPPFFPARAGTPARHARGSRSGELGPFVCAARDALSGPRTRAVFCYPAGALAELLECARDARLVPKRLRLVHARAEAPARLALVELRIAKPGGLVIEPPLVEWLSGRARSPELARIVSGDFGPFRASS
jgi:tRNA1Val (adenine37-N6)-methyltransferase